MADKTPIFIDTTKPATQVVTPVIAPIDEPTWVQKILGLVPSLPSFSVPNWKVYFHSFLASVFAGFITFQGGAILQSRHDAPAVQAIVEDNSSLQEQLKTTQSIADANAQEAIEAKAKLNDIQGKVPTQIEKIKKFYLLLKKPDGSLELRTGGTVSWRYNNPGKILYGTFAKAHGAIDHDGPLAIFGSYDDGVAALEALLFGEDSTYKNLTLAEAIVKLAPSKDGYNPTEYLSYLVKNTKVKKTTVLSELTTDDRTDLITAIRDHEHFVAGQDTNFKDQTEFDAKGTK